MERFDVVRRYLSRSGYRHVTVEAMYPISSRVLTTEGTVRESRSVRYHTDIGGACGV